MTLPVIVPSCYLVIIGYPLLVIRLFDCRSSSCDIINKAIINHDPNARKYKGEHGGAERCAAACRHAFGKDLVESMTSTTKSLLFKFGGAAALFGVLWATGIIEAIFGLIVILVQIGLFLLIAPVALSILRVILHFMPR